MAVDSEHKKNIQHDLWRLFQLEKDLSNPNHPYHKFGTGNLSTLRDIPASKGIAIREALLEFHDQYYSANIMKLVVMGKESIDELESWIRVLFEPVKNSNVQLEPFEGHPLSKSESGLITIVKPIKDWKHIQLTFGLPDTSKDYQIDVSKYFSHLIGHEGDGSITALLKRRGWATDLSAGTQHGGAGFDFFKISITLTENGLENYKQVVLSIFQYIHMLQTSPVYEWIFQEVIFINDNV
jgi:insulysin